MKKTRIISAFPACGKTHLFEKGYEDAVIIDSDSSQFSYLGGIPRERNPKFPNNYMDHIKENIGKVDYIFVSSHIEIRKALDEADMRWVLVAPEPSLMLEWVGRCYLRGNTEDFIKTMVNNWSNWTRLDMTLSPIGWCRLGSGEYLEDRMRFIETLTGN